MKTSGATGSVSCPACSSRLKWTELKFGEPFVCPHCRCELQVPQRYSVWMHWTTVVLCFIVAYFTADSFTKMLLIVLISYFPVAMIVTTIFRWTVPPRVEPARSGILGLGPIP